MALRPVSLASRVLRRMQMTKRSAFHYRPWHRGELPVQTDRSVLANNVLLVRRHAAPAMVHHRTTVSYVPPDNPCSMAVVSPRTLTVFVKDLMEWSLTTINRSVIVRISFLLTRQGLNSLISLACGAKCTSCKIPNFNVASTVAQLQCTGCLPGFFLSQGKCVESCPSGTFVSSQDNLTCTGTIPVVFTFDVD